MIYLLLTVLAPFVGAYLLRTLTSTVFGTDHISWFSTSLFVLAAGVRCVRKRIAAYDL